MKLMWRMLSACLLMFSLVPPAPAQGGGSPSIQLHYVTVLVKDQDEALRWYTKVLGLKKVEDTPFGPGKRWLVVAGEGQSFPGIVLELATGSTKMARMGKETNWVFTVRDCFAFYEQLRARGVHFAQPAIRQPWGTVQAVFEDPYGNVFIAESNATQIGAGAK